MRKICDEAQLLVECKKYKEVYIYGAGMVGGLVVGHLRNICSCFDGKINLKGLIISKRADDIVYSYGLPLYQFDEIADDIRSKDALVCVSVIEEKQMEIQQFLQMNEVNNVDYISDDCIKELLRIREQGNAAIMHRINELENSIIRLIPRPILNVSYHVTDVCNLNCKGCWHFAPLATALNKNQRADIEEFERDVKRLSELLDGELAKFSLFGGEPLLHEEAYKFPYIVKNISQIRQ